MEKADLEELRGKVACGAVLETAGFAVDPKESTRRAVKYRRGDEIIIVYWNGSNIEVAAERGGYFDTPGVTPGPALIDDILSGAFEIVPSRALELRLDDGFVAPNRR